MIVDVYIVWEFYILCGQSGSLDMSVKWKTRSLKISARKQKCIGKVVNVILSSAKVCVVSDYWSFVSVPI